ncbi:MAG: family 65 glycosyl hydrolase, partial [bacterium]|nr:family 65 glycosyl hydrolase [bacterium]
MHKVATRYLDVDPWVIRERGFHPARAAVSESIFALGNEFMGVRGHFDEGYAGAGMTGSYFNGIFEEEDIPYTQYFKGFATRTHFMVNAVDWLHTRLWLDDEQLDLARCRIGNFVRQLDLRTGVLERSFVWTTCGGKRLRLSFSRFTSMADPALGGQRVQVTPLNFSGALRVRTGLDFSVPHHARGVNLWRAVKHGRAGGAHALMAAVQRSGQRVFSSFQLHGVPAAQLRPLREEKFIGVAFSLPLQDGTTTGYDKLVVNLTEKCARVADATVWTRGITQARRLSQLSYDMARQRHVAFWADVWRTLDITISGDDAAQQGIRFCLF